VESAVDWQAEVEIDLKMLPVEVEILASLWDPEEARKR